MATIRELVVKFGFDVDDAPLKKMEDGIETLKAGFVAVTSAAVAAGAAIFGIAKSTANAADAIKDTSIAVGISYEQLQKLGYAATLSGASQEELGDSLRFLARSSVEAKDANSEAAKNFAQLGISAVDASGNLKKPNEILLLLADAFKKMPAGMEKTAMAMNFFGRSGSKLVQFLDNGSAGLSELSAEAESLGIVMSDASIEAGAKFNDTLDSLMATIKGIINTIGSGLIPVITEIMTDMRSWIKANRELIKTRLQSFIQVLVKYLQQFWRVLSAIFATTKMIISGIDNVTKSLGGFANILKVLFAAVGLFILGKMGIALFDVAKGFLLIGKAAIAAWKSAFIGPILIGAAIAAIFLIVEDFLAFLDGRPSVLGFILKNKEKVLEQIYTWFNKISDFIYSSIKKISVFIAGLFGVSASEATRYFDIIYNTVMGFIGNTINAFVFLGDTIINVWQNIVNLVLGIFSSLQSLFSGNFLEAITTFGNTIYNALVGIFGGLFSTIGDAMKMIFTSVVEFVLGIASSIGAKIKAAVIDPIVNALSEVKGFIKSKFGVMASALGIDLGVSADTPEGTKQATSPLGITPAIAQQAQGIISAPFGGITPEATTNAQNQSTITNELKSTINVTVPAGSNADDIGEAVRRAAAEEFTKIIKPAARATQGAVAY